MTLLSTSESSPNCVRSLDAQLEATTLVSKDAKHEGDARISPSVASLKAVPRDKTNNELPIYAIRNLVIRLTVVTGTLSSLFLTTVPSDGTEFFKGNAVVATTMAHLLTALMELSSSLAINLHMACCKKIDLNCRKYPVDLCKVRSCIERALK